MLEFPFSRVFESHPLPMWVYAERSLEIVAVNQAAINQYGYTREEFCTLTLLDIRPPEYRADCERILSGPLPTVYHVTTTHMRKNDERFQVEIMSHPLELDEFDARIVTARDVTLNREAETALRREHELLQRITDTVPDAIFVKDLEGRYLFANEATARFAGVSKAEVLGKTDEELFDPDTAWEFKAADTHALHTGGPTWREEKATLHGVETNFLAVKTPMRDDAGNVVGVIGISRDVTEQRARDEQLRSTQDRLNLVLQQTPIVMWMTDRDFNITGCDGGGFDWLPVTPDEVVGVNLSRWFDMDSEQAQAHRRALQGHIATYQSMNYERDFKTHVHPLRDKFENIVGIVAVAIDITDAVDQERVLKQKEEQLQQAQKMEAIGRLAGGVAHDFNNILTAISGHTEFVLESLDPRDPMVPDLEEIRSAAHRAAGLTRQLLAFSRRQVLQPSVVDLYGAVESVKKMLTRLIGEDIELSVVERCSACCVRADRGQIEQVVMNLAVNARDAMPDGGKLFIETSSRVLLSSIYGEFGEIPKGDYAVLSVRDIGEGIAPDVLPRIFEPFFSTKEIGQGTGLGLATAYGIIKQSGGYVDVKSTVGVGTVFEIYLPRIDEQPTQQAAPQAAVQTGFGETVLLVEDEDGVRTMAERVLRRKGYNVITAANGGEAMILAEMHDGAIQMLITDVVMPRMTGSDLARFLAKRLPDMKVLFMSGYNDEAIARHGVLTPGSAFIQKPFTPEELALKVRELLDS